MSDRLPDRDVIGVATAIVPAVSCPELAELRSAMQAVPVETDESLEQAVSDDKRTGRKRKLSESQQDEFEATVHEPPEAVGIDAPAWTPALVQQYLDETYGVEYSLPSCRRLLKEAGLSYQKPRRSAAEADEDEQEEFRDDLKKSSGSWTPP